MKKCPFCKSENNDETYICEACGSFLGNKYTGPQASTKFKSENVKNPTSKKSIAKPVKKIIKTLITCGFVASELIGVFMILSSLYSGSNVGGLVIGFLLLPVFVVTLPVMFIFNDGNWTLFLLTYGAAIILYFSRNLYDPM